MPEHPEIRAFVNFINMVSSTIEFNGILIGNIEGPILDIPDKF